MKVKALQEARDLYNKIVINSENRISHSDAIKSCNTAVELAMKYTTDTEKAEFLRDIKSCLDHLAAE